MLPGNGLGFFFFSMPSSSQGPHSNRRWKFSYIRSLLYFESVLQIPVLPCAIAHQQDEDIPRSRSSQFRPQSPRAVTPNAMQDVPQADSHNTHMKTSKYAPGTSQGGWGTIGLERGPRDAHQNNAPKKRPI
jgi:hypothetical protein